MDVLAVIPAVVGLAARRLTGRPLIMHTIEQARAARRVTRTVVMTVDAELSGLATEADAEVVEVSPGHMSLMLATALETLAARDGFAPALAVLLDPFFPLRTTEMIESAIELVWGCGADSLVSVYPLAESLWAQDELGRARPLDPVAAEQRYVESGVVSAVRIGPFRQTGELPTGRVVLYRVTPTTALRIADGADWANVELLHRSSAAARARSLLHGIELLVLDFDGVLTDNRVVVFEDGREAVLCNRGDGMGVGLLAQAGVAVAVISKEVNPVVGARCRKLNIPCLQGIDDKLAELQQITRDRRLELPRVAYMGNDVNDLDCMRAAGVAIAPADAHPQALRAADIVTSAPGGFGAVREVCDLLLAARREPALTPAVL